MAHVQEPGKPLGAFTVLGHRGAKGHAPENTLASFRKAIELKATMTELDIHTSKDGHLIVMHDPVVDRTTNGSGRITDLTLEEIRRLDAGSWYGPKFAGEKVPTLQEVIDVIKGHIDLNVEVKGGELFDPDLVDLLIEHIISNDIVEHVVVSSFQREYLREIKRKAPAVQIALLYSAELSEPWKEAEDEGWHLHPHLRRVDAQLIDEAHSRGIMVRAWNPNAAEDMRPLVRLGVDGIGTDNPEVLLRVLAEEGR